MNARPHGPLPAGYEIHWYRIEGVLGQGGFGITYRAVDTNLDQPVAIKEFVPVDLAVRTPESSIAPQSDEKRETYGWGLSSFITEAKTLAQFQHPNIVRVSNVFELNRTAYMVMELIDGQSFAQVLRRRSMRGEEDLRAFALQLLDGLEEVHKAGFIHRDVKPDNIYLRRDGTPVLLDFGSARQALTGRTRTLTALVSPGYAPYEQYGTSLHHDKQGPWTDIYALGATLYRAVTGRGPVDAMDRINAVLEGRDLLVPAHQICAGWYSPELLRAIDAALAFRPVDRPQSVAAWRAMFLIPPTGPRTLRLDSSAPNASRTLRHETPAPSASLPIDSATLELVPLEERASEEPASVAEPVGPATRSKAPARRRRLAVPFRTVLVLLAIMAGGWYWQQASRSPPAGEPTAAESRDPPPKSTPQIEQANRVFAARQLGGQVQVLEASSAGLELRYRGNIQNLHTAVGEYCRTYHKRSSLLSADPRTHGYQFICH